MISGFHKPDDAIVISDKGADFLLVALVVLCAADKVLERHAARAERAAS